MEGNGRGPLWGKIKQHDDEIENLEQIVIGNCSESEKTSLRFRLNEVEVDNRRRNCIEKKIMKGVWAVASLIVLKLSADLYAMAKGFVVILRPEQTQNYHQGERNEK